jgi:hypothetical protein
LDGDVRGELVADRNRFKLLGVVCVFELSVGGMGLSPSFVTAGAGAKPAIHVY